MTTCAEQEELHVEQSASMGFMCMIRIICFRVHYGQSVNYLAFKKLSADVSLDLILCLNELLTHFVVLQCIGNRN